MKKLSIITTVMALTLSFAAQAHEVAGSEHYEIGDVNSHTATYKEMDAAGLDTTIFNLNGVRNRSEETTFGISYGHITLEPEVKNYGTNVRGVRWVENISWETVVYVTTYLAEGEKPFHFHPYFSRNALPADKL